MPKAPSSVGRDKRSRSGAAAASGGPKFHSAAPSRQAQGNLASQLRQDEVSSRFGGISQPGKRQKNKHRSQDGEQQDADTGMADSSSGGGAAGPSQHPFVTGGKAGGGLGGQRDKYVDKRLSGKILRLAREQQDEIEREDDEQSMRPLRLQEPRGSSSGAAASGDRLGRLAADGFDDDDDDDDDGAGGSVGTSNDDGELADAPSDEEEFEYEEVEVDPEDEALLERMRQDRLESAGDQGGRRTLADLIMDKIDAAGSGGLDGQPQGADGEGAGMINGMNPKIVEVYTK